MAPHRAHLAHGSLSSLKGAMSYVCSMSCQALFMLYEVPCAMCALCGAILGQALRPTKLIKTSGELLIDLTLQLIFNLFLY